MKKNYYFLLLLAFLSVNLINAQFVCPELIGNQSTTTTLVFKITNGTCGVYPLGNPNGDIFVTQGSLNGTFIFESCNGTNLKYTFLSGDSLTDTENFNILFPPTISPCGYINGALTTLSNNDVSLNESVSVFPNPLLKDNQLTVKTPFNITAKLFMYDVTGKIAITDEIDNLNRKQISTSTLTNGVYFLQLVTDNATITRKVIIMK